MENSNEAKASEHEDGVDMISKLPDPILHLILSRIHNTDEVIRTSVLSTRWRYLWTSVPSISIDYTRGLDPLKFSEPNKFEEYVYWVLLNNSVNLNTFLLWCGHFYDMSTVSRWIHAAVMKKVKSLEMMFCPRKDTEDIKLPHCLVTCSSLEELTFCLLGCSLNLPKFAGFPALRVLELNDVNFLNGDLVNYFLETPLLEDLSLVECKASAIVISCPKLKNLRIHNQEPDTVKDPEKYSNWRMCASLEISCPKLVYLKLTGYAAMEFLPDSLDSLKKAVIHPKDLFFDEEPTYYVVDELFNVEYLSTSLYFVQQCYNPGIDDPIFLPNLKTLELTVDALHILIPFLICLPNLESLYLIFPKKVWGLEKWEVDEPVTMSILTCHLKKVKFLEFDGETEKLVVARALMENGDELEEMFFNWDKVERERVIETMKVVSKFHKASSIVKVRSAIAIRDRVVFGYPEY